MDSMFLAFLARRKYELHYDLLIDKGTNSEKDRGSRFEEKKRVYDVLGQVIEALPSEDKKVVNDLFESLKDILESMEGKES